MREGREASSPGPTAGLPSGVCPLPVQRVRCPLQDPACAHLQDASGEGLCWDPACRWWTRASEARSRPRPRSPYFSSSLLLDSIAAGLLLETAAPGASPWCCPGWVDLVMSCRTCLVVEPPPLAQPDLPAPPLQGGQLGCVSGGGRTLSAGNSCTSDNSRWLTAHLPAHQCPLGSASVLEAGSTFTPIC